MLPSPLQLPPHMIRPPDPNVGSSKPTPIRKICFVLLFASFPALACAQNLLSNASFESGNTSFESTYTYSATDTIPAGVYSIVHNPYDTHSGAASFGDHTTGTGLMLVANGSSSLDDVVWRQTVSVQQDRNYAFSGFAASWGDAGGQDPNPPFILVFINGQQQALGVQVPSTNGQWQNFTAVWNSGLTTQAIIEIRLGSSAGFGNDLSLDDLSFRLLEDTDGDGLTDVQEVQLSQTSPVLADTDNDGQEDGMEDPDADGLTNAQEILEFRTNPLAADSDGDGFNDLFELKSGFDPMSQGSTPDALTTILPAVEFRFNAAAGVIYRIEGSNDLQNWTVIEPTVTGQGGVVTRLYSITAHPTRYLRVRRN
jgi:hypothetical protein